MTIQGKFKKQLDVVERTNFKSRKVWITTEDNPQYPQTIELEVQQDKVDMFSGVSEGAPVTCHVNLRGRLWTGTDGVEKCFNTIVVWKVEADKAHTPVENSAMDRPAPEVQDTSGLPF